MPITTGDIRRDCYECINRNPRIVAVAGNATKYDPYDHVTHAISPPLVFRTGSSRIRQISFHGLAGGDSYYLPFQIDGITSVSLPTIPTFAEPKYFFTIRLTACAIFLDAYQPAPGTYTTPLGADDQRPRIIISHGNAATPYADGMVGVDVGQNPAMFPNGARARLNNDRNAMLATYPGVKMSLAALYKNDYNQRVDEEVRRLIGQGHVNVAYGSTTSVFGFYGPGGWEFYFQTWGGYDYMRQRMILGPQQILGATNLNEHRVIECRRFFP